MSREKLPDLRQGINHTFRIGGTVKGYLTVGLSEDGRPLEVFLKISKQGSAIGGFAGALARLTSISLQYGVPLVDICQKMRGLRFEPMGVTGNKDIPEAASIVDYVFTWLEQQFVRPPADRDEP